MWYSRTITLGDSTLSVSYEYESNVPVFIAFHQITTFVVLTSHNAWFDGVLFKSVDPLAVAVI